MSDGRKEAERMISARQRKNTIAKNRYIKTMSENSIVLKFVDAMEKVQKESSISLEFQDGLHRASRDLERHMRMLDSGVVLEVMWSPTLEDNWRDLSVEGVRIIHSDTYCALHPDAGKEMTIDVGTLLIEGMLK